MSYLLIAGEIDIEARGAFLLSDACDVGHMFDKAMLHGEDVANVLREHHHAKNAGAPEFAVCHGNLDTREERSHHMPRHLTLGIELRVFHGDTVESSSRLFQLVVVCGYDPKIRSRYVEVDGLSVHQFRVLEDVGECLLPVLHIHAVNDALLQFLDDSHEDALLHQSEVAGYLRIDDGVIEPSYIAQFRYDGVRRHHQFVLLRHFFLFLALGRVFLLIFFHTYFYKRFY